MWDCIKKIRNDTTPILLFGSEPFSSNLRMSNIQEYKYDWIWHKNSSGDFALAKKRPMKYHEIITVFYLKQPYYNPIFQKYADSMYSRFKDGDICKREAQLKKSTNKIQNGLSLKPSRVISFDRGKYPESVQYFKSVHNHSRHHPSEKPIDLLEYLIKTYTKENDTVLDFTMGSGSTGIACQNTNRNFVGIELEEEYYNIACERLKENEKQTKLI